MRNKMGVRSISSVGISAQAPKVDGASIGNASYSASGTSNAQRNRLLAVGIIVAAAFSALAVKLFGLQVVSSASYQSEAESNLYTTVRTPAPRGVIYDRDGVPLVTNRQVQTVLADADVANNTNVILRLSALLGIPYDVVRARILDASTGAQSQRVVAKDVRLRDVAYINEHRDAFPGISRKFVPIASTPTVLLPLMCSAIQVLLRKKIWRMLLKDAISRWAMRSARRVSSSLLSTCLLATMVSVRSSPMLPARSSRL